MSEGDRVKRKKKGPFGPTLLYTFERKLVLELFEHTVYIEKFEPEKF